MKDLLWYCHRLRAMGPAEIAGHARKKLFQLADTRRERDWGTIPLESAGVPRLPDKSAAPAVLREALKRDVQDVLAGRWRAFGHLEINVDDPPQWHTDYLVGKNLATAQSAFQLNHRDLPGGADIKLIWELSRWHQLVRLAMAAYLLADPESARKCVSWLEDWVTHNAPYRGWNWTSALEAGLRLTQFTWIDALLKPAASRWGLETKLETLCYEILPAHCWFIWRHRSFGSSANNHIIGELSGLIVATARWPALAQWGSTLERLQTLWEREVLSQFAEDGGNKEQALNYHVFSWEFCWQARAALQAAGRKIDPRVENRLSEAARFFWEVQASGDVWDYGDSDNAFVTPWFCDQREVVREWRGWLEESKAGLALTYWLGQPPALVRLSGGGGPPATVPAGGWWIYPQSGMALCESGFWWLRWDLSPLGYLRTAAHGHFDALHLSIWFKRVAMVIDPGTGAYYADEGLRTWLASRAAHNGPCPARLDSPRRAGPFLWSGHHARPVWGSAKEKLSADLALPGGRLERHVASVDGGIGWHVDDAYRTENGVSDEFSVRWQFAPGSFLKRLGERRFSLQRADISIRIQLDEKWGQVHLVEPLTGTGTAATGNFDGVVSPAFRKTCLAPCLKLTARGSEKPCLFRTTFLASDAS